MLAWALKNYPGALVGKVSGRRAVGDPSSNLKVTKRWLFRQKGGTALESIASRAKVVIFGSCGGNDASSGKANSNSLKPGGAWDQELEKLFNVLLVASEGTFAFIVGLPYGQNDEKGGSGGALAKRREAMDKALARKAKFNVPYASVFEQTKKIKLAAATKGRRMTGNYKVHYHYPEEKVAV